MELLFESRSLSALELLAELKHDDGEASYSIQKDGEPQRDAVPPEIVVAAISAAGPLLTAILVFLFNRFLKRPDDKIAILLDDGQRIEVPSGLSEEKIEKLVNAIKAAGRPRIIVP